MLKAEFLDLENDRLVYSHRPDENKSIKIYYCFTIELGDVELYRMNGDPDEGLSFRSIVSPKSPIEIEMPTIKSPLCDQVTEHIQKEKNYIPIVKEEE